MLSSRNAHLKAEPGQAAARNFPVGTTPEHRV